LQIPRQTIGNNLNNIRQKSIEYFRKKAAKIKELETHIKANILYIV
jgi:hypothetical protein